MPRTLAFLILLQLWQALVEGESGSWKWSTPLTDEEIVDLLYTDPDRLRALAGKEDNGYYSQLEENEVEKPSMLSITSYHKDITSNHGGAATSYTRVQHFATRNPEKDLSAYANHILHS